LQRTIAVLICSYRRANDLLRCLQGLRNQDRPADDIMIVVRFDDADTRAALASEAAAGLPIRILFVAEPGLIAARNVGLEACRSDFIALTDDDTVPRPDWLARIVAHFESDPGLGGVGGRDRCLAGTEWNEGKKKTIGHITWFGRMSGYHHLGFGDPRAVQILKGANMSYRRRAVGATRADTRLRGSGAQPHEDSTFALAIRRKGWSLLYDPSVLVDHYESPREEARHYGGIAAFTNAESFKEGPYNWVLSLWEEFPPHRHVAFILWNFLIGTRVAPGLVQALRFTPRLGRTSWRRFWLTQVATYEAYRGLFVKAPEGRKAGRELAA
jgi:glycosyltransferase involved in cell wall biosynthesis